jgi:HEAT repeat protein
MTANLKTGLAVGLLLVLTNLAVASEEPTKADIPQNLPAELRATIEQTFSPDPEKRAEAATRLGEMGKKAAPAIPFLIRLLGDDASISKNDYVYVSTVAGDSLAEIGASAVEPLLQAFGQSSGRKRLAALYILGRLKDRRVIAKFLSLLGDPDEEIRWRAADSVKCYLKDNPEFRELAGVKQSLIRALEDRNSFVRTYVAEALGECRYPEAFEPLLKMLKDADDSARGGAIRALGDLGDPRAREELRQIVRTASRKIRHYGDEGSAAARSLGQLGRKGDDKGFAFDFLIGTAESLTENEFIRCGAIYGLGELGDRRAIESLLRMVGRESGEPVWVRGAAISAIAALQGREAAPLLKRWAVDDVEARWNRYIAAERLANVTDGEVDDVAIVKLIADSYRVEGGDPDKLTLKKIIEHGKTKEVRQAAQQGIDKALMPENERK